MLALAPDHLEALWVVGLGEERANNREKAIALFEQVLTQMAKDAPDRALVQQRLDGLKVAN